MKSISKRLLVTLVGIIIPIVFISAGLYLYYTEKRIDNLAGDVEKKIPVRVELVLNQIFDELSSGAKGRREYFDSLLVSNNKIFEKLIKSEPKRVESALDSLKVQFLKSLPDSFYVDLDISLIDSSGNVVYSSKREFLNLDLKEMGSLWDTLKNLKKEATHFLPLSFSSRDAKMRSYIYLKLNSGYYTTLSLDINSLEYRSKIERLKGLSVFIKDIGVYNVAKESLLEFFSPYPRKVFRKRPFYRDIEEDMEFSLGTTKLRGLLFARLDFYPLFSILLFSFFVYLILITTLSLVSLYVRKLVKEESHNLAKIIEMVRHLEDPEEISERVRTKEVVDLVKVLHTHVIKTNEKIKENEVLFMKFRSAFYNFSEKLAVLAERIDPEDAGHLKRVKYLTKLILDNMEIDEDYKNAIVEFSVLHDIGKIFIPSALLNKVGPLTEEERELVRKHTILAERLLSHPELKIAREIAVYHHENYDGTGYPFGLKGEEIPFPARVVKLTNTYDVLRSERPYKKGLSHEEALKILLVGDKKTNPSHFDPKILSVFLKVCKDTDPLSGLVEF